MSSKMNKELAIKPLVEVDMGNKSVFTAVYNLYYEPLCFFAQRYVEDSLQAEDIIGELFAKLWQQNISFNDEEHLKAYLYRSASNACYTHSKYTERLKAREEHYALASDQIEETFFDNIIRANLWTEVYRAMDELPPQCAQVIKMSFVEDLKNPEIADRLGISLQTVKNHKHRGLSILRGSISKDAFFALVFCNFIIK